MSGLGQDALADAVGGAMADAAMAASQGIEDAGGWLKNRIEDQRQYDFDSHMGQLQFDYEYNISVQQMGGLRDYNHFDELPHEWGSGDMNEGTLPLFEPRSDTYGLGVDIAEATYTAAQAIADKRAPASYNSTIVPPFVTGTPAIDELSDFVTVEGRVDGVGALVRPGQAESLRFDLDAGDRLGTDLREDVGDYATDYIFDASSTDGRLIGGGFRNADMYDVADAAEAIAENAEAFSVEMRQMRTEFTSDGARSHYFRGHMFNHTFEGGRLDASDTTGGAVLIGRDGGRHLGGSGNDLGLDASTARMGAGDDIAILDNETGYLADGGEGNDILIGGRAAETFIGGEGRDEIHAGDGDTVVATPGEDRADTIRFEGMDLHGPRGAHADGTLVGDHGETYEPGADGGDLTVRHGDRSLTIEDFENGDFGIDLPTGAWKDARLGTEPGGTSLADASDYLRDHGEAVLKDLYTRESWSLEEGALADALDSPAADAMMHTLGDNGEDRLDVEIDSSAPYEVNAMEIVRAAGAKLEERGLVEDYVAAADDMADERGWSYETVHTPAEHALEADDDYSYSLA